MSTRAMVPLLALFVLMSTAAIRAAVAARSGLVATAASQRIQNRRADAQNLSRMRNARMVLRFRHLGLLVPVRTSTPWYYLHSIPANLRYLRPWARLFLTRLGREFHARFGTRLRIPGLIRTMNRQQRLEQINVNAADATGPERSSHLTGATLDISKRFMQPAHARWVRHVLTELRDQDVLYAIEEFHQPCFHVMVYRSYLDYVDRLTAG